MFILKVRKSFRQGQTGRFYSEMLRRQEIRRNIAFAIYVVFTVALIVSIPFGLTMLARENHEEYLISSDSIRNLIHDEDMLMDTEDRQALIEATEGTIGQYYEIHYVNVNAESQKDLYNMAQTKMRNVSNPLQVTIFHNVNDDKYYLWPSISLIVSSKAFDLIEYNNNRGITQQFFFRTNEAYGKLLHGTPAEVYMNVFNHVMANGFGDETEKFLEEYISESDIGFFFLGILLAIPLGIIIWCLCSYLYDNILDDYIFPGEYGWLDIRIVEYYQEKERKMKEEKAKREKEQQELLKKQKEAEQKLEKAREEKLHATMQLVEAIQAFNCCNPEIQQKKELMLEKLNVVDNIIASGRASVNDIHFYLDSFAKSLMDINNYAWTHHTKMDTPEEIAIINETFDVFMEIVTSFNQKYEAADVSNIAVTLNVVRSKAAFDGLINNGMNI